MKRMYNCFQKIFNFAIGKKLNVGMWRSSPSTVFRWINLHPKIWKYWRLFYLKAKFEYFECTIYKKIEIWWDGILFQIVLDK
jgi:hypothetical protein